MSLTDRLKQGPGQVHGTPCSVRTLLESLPDDEAASLRAMLDDPAWPHNVIERAIREEGYTIGTGQVGRHRRGGCACGDKL